ncbi:MAG: FG-GAP-like repeat-containing protein [Thermoanaerobaculia bacterium]
MRIPARLWILLFLSVSCIPTLVSAGELTPVFANLGEPVNTFPKWEERAFIELTNRARVEPSTELASCTGCSTAELSGTCYTPVAPLNYNANLNHSSRFYSDFLARASLNLQHDTRCTLVNNISSLYPNSCDGSVSCSCSGGVLSGTTTWTSRIALFGSTAGAENLARSYATPKSAFYALLLESTTNTTCTFSLTNGHRWNILKAPGPGVGVGYSDALGEPYWTQDFGSGSSPSKLVSGAHWATDGTRQGSTVEFWANWYDSSAPTQSSVVVDGTSYALTLDRGTTTNGAWTTSRTGLGSGCHRYYFQFKDSGSTTWKYPTTGTFGIGDPATCADWQAATAFVRGDFNGDTKPDLIWRNYSTGAVNVWFLNGTTYTSGANLFNVADSNWRIDGVGDFNGDGKSDLIWRNYSTGAVNVWFLNGTTYVSGANLFNVADPNWKIEAVGDFNGDGKDDLIWRNYTTGAVNAWFLNGTTYTSGANLFSVADPNWKIEGAADFNNDGKTDLIWRNYATGAVNVWFLNGTTYVSGANLFNVADPNWKIQAIGDYNNDGHPDLIWRNYATGAVNVWFLNGTTYLSGTNLYSVADPNWEIAGP